MPEFNHLKSLIFLLIILDIFLNRLFSNYQVNKWCKWLINLFKYHSLTILNLNFLKKNILISSEFIILKEIFR